MTLKKGECLWRVQIGTELKQLEDYPDTELPNVLPDHRMKPLPNKAVEGRINPKGIPCLYLATSEKIAISEVRPWMKALITIGKFKIVQDQKLIKFCDDDNIPFTHIPRSSNLEAEKQVWSDVSTAFTKPVGRDDDVTEYIPTQIIAEFFKEKGFHGVAYRSAFSEKGMNIALFDIDAAELICKDMLEIENIDVNWITNPFL